MNFFFVIFFTLQELVSIRSGYVIVVYSDLGGNATLHCPYEGDGTMWHGIGGYQYSLGVDILTSLPLHLRQRLSIVKDTGFALNIYPVANSDAGNYVCTGSNGSVSRSLVIKAPPTDIDLLNVSEGSIEADEGKNVTVVCIVRGGQPPPNISMYWKGEQMTTGIGTNLTLTIIPRREDQSTNLTCTANHPLLEGSLEKTATLQLNLGPLTVTMSNDAVFYEDKPTDITCMSTGSRPPEEFTFYVNNELVNTSSTLYSFTPNGTYDVRSTLTFSPDRKHHKGTVSCQVFNRSSQSVISKYQTMEVYFPPRISIKTESIGSTTTLHCQPDGNPKAYTFANWSHVSFFNEHIRYLMGPKSDMLEIRQENTSTVYENNGMYSCFAQNGIRDKDGQLVQVGTSALKFKGEPESAAGNKYVYSTKMGEEVIITHTFFSDPEPSSSEWYRLSPSGEWQSLDPLEHTTLSNQAVITTVKYGISIHSSGYMNSLTIKYMKPSDLSYYVLNVRNEYGNMTAKIHVKQNSEFEGSINDTRNLSVGAGIAMISVASFLFIVLLIGFCILRKKHKAFKKKQTLNDEVMNQFQENRRKDTRKENVQVRGHSSRSNADTTSTTIDERYVPEERSDVNDSFTDEWSGDYSSGTAPAYDDAISDKNPGKEIVYNYAEPENRVNDDYLAPNRGSSKVLSDITVSCDDRPDGMPPPLPARTYKGPENKVNDDYIAPDRGSSKDEFNEKVLPCRDDRTEDLPPPLFARKNNGVNDDSLEPPSVPYKSFQMITKNKIDSIEPQSLPYKSFSNIPQNVPVGDPPIVQTNAETSNQAIEPLDILPESNGSVGSHTGDTVVSHTGDTVVSHTGDTVVSHTGDTVEQNADGDSEETNVKEEADRKPPREPYFDTYNFVNSEQTIPMDIDREESTS